MTTTAKWPTTVYIIRHGEKPGAGDSPPGVDAQGNLSSSSLTARGWQRAAGLAVLFGGLPIAPSGLDTPELLIAPLYEASGSPDSDEHRAYETIEPLGALLNIRSRASGGQAMSVSALYTTKQHKEVVEQIRGAGVDTVLVAWEHHNIQRIAAHLTTDPVPAWPGDRFDLIWCFTLDPSGTNYVFAQGPQLLVTGDSRAVVPVPGSSTTGAP
jgi:hypothetical protein